VGEGDDDDLVRANAVDDLVGEARHEKTAGPVVGGQRAPDLWIQSQAINGLGYLVQ